MASITGLYAITSGLAQVLSREADLALGSDIGQTHSELATERLFSERMALFLRHDHPYRILALRLDLQGAAAAGQFFAQALCVLMGLLA